MSNDQQWLVLRTQEIIDQSKEISGRDAVKAALRDRYSGDFEKLLDFTAGLTNVLKKLARDTYALPDQPTLMDIPQTIAIQTDAGLLFMKRDEAQLGHVRQWVFEGLQYHSAQRYRFSRIVKSLKALEGVSDEISWNDVRHQIESGSSDDGPE